MLIVAVKDCKDVEVNEQDLADELKDFESRELKYWWTKLRKLEGVAYVKGYIENYFPKKRGV